MTDKKFMTQVSKESQRRFSRMRSENSEINRQTVGLATYSCEQRGHRSPTLKKRFHVASFVQGAQYALELLKAEREQRKIMNG